MGAPGKTAKAFRWAHGSWHARHAQYGLPRSNHSAKKLASTSLAMPSKLFQASLSITSRGVSELTNLMDLPQALAAVEPEASISSSHSSRFVLEENIRWACPRRLSVQLTSWILRASQAQVRHLLARSFLAVAPAFRYSRLGAMVRPQGAQAEPQGRHRRLVPARITREAVHH